MSNKSPADLWNRNLFAVSEFVRISGRFPLKTAKADEHERRLAHWRHHNVSLLNRGLLAPDRAEALKRAGLAENPDNRTWNAMLDRTIAFVREHGRYPSRNGSTKEERVTGRWRNNQNGFLKNGKLAEQRKIRFVDEGLSGTIFEQNWTRILKKVVLFQKEHGYLPRSSGDSALEISLAAWCTKNRNLLKQRYPAVKNRRVTLINAARVDDAKFFKSRWEEHYARLRAFCQKNGRLPPSGGSREEYLNYVWYRYQIRALKNGTLNDDRAKRIAALRDAHQPEKGAGNAKWRDRYIRLSIFIEKNGRLPVYSKNRIANENRLSLWLQRQRELVKHRKLGNEEIRLLSRLHPTLADTVKWTRSRVAKNHSQWEEKYRLVREMVDTTGYLPSQNSTNPPERRLYSWFLRELNKAKNGVLAFASANRIQQLFRDARVRKSGPREATCPPLPPPAFQERQF